MTWLITTLYIPLINSSLTVLQGLLISITMMVLAILSLILHTLAHAATAKILKNPIPEQLPLFLIADPAQVWLFGRTAGRDALTAIAGPLANILLAGIFYSIWNLQFNVLLDLIALFLALFNLLLAVINLSPGFPLDGGRLVRSIIWAGFKSPALGTRLAKWLGFGLVAFLTGWGFILVLGHPRLTWAAAAIAFVEAALFSISLVFSGRISQPEHNEDINPKFSTPFNWISCSVLVLPLLLFAIGLLPLNLGLQAPGTTASVEPMVQVPPQYLHESNGKLILTSVIPQAPILFFEWVYARFDTSVRIVPEEEIVPPNQTVQSQAQEGHQMLASSESIATAEGLRLAGYHVTEISEGVIIDVISSDSPAATILETGDLITQLNGQVVKSTTDLHDLLGGLGQGAILSLGIIREGQPFVVTVPTLPPSAPGGAIRIGISVHTDVTGFDFPFPIEIKPQKIVGGPSAGLMFTLAVYDLVTPGDLTSGRIIAGTGTIDLDGNVGPIGGVEQKVVAAERAGAKYFLVPADNYQDALKAAKNIQVIRVTSAQEAIDVLKTLPLP